MVQVTIVWLTEIKNTGIQHDMIVGCSLLHPSTGEELVRFPWWVVSEVPSGFGFGIELTLSGDIPARTYLGKCRAWTGYTPKNKVQDFTVDGLNGALYAASWEDLLEPPILDEATQTLVISPAAVSAEILNFSITV